MAPLWSFPLLAGAAGGLLLGAAYALGTLGRRADINLADLTVDYEPTDQEMQTATVVSWEEFVAAHPFVEHGPVRRFVRDRRWS